MAKENILTTAFTFKKTICMLSSPNKLPYAFMILAFSCSACLVLSCLVSLECTLGGLFLAHAAAGLHCTVQSITPPWAGCLDLVHLNHLGAFLHMYCPVFDHKKIRYVPICLQSRGDSSTHYYKASPTPWTSPTYVFIMSRVGT